jgi:hypothetical protein
MVFLRLYANAASRTANQDWAESIFMFLDEAKEAKICCCIDVKSDFFKVTPDKRIASV